VKLAANLALLCVAGILLIVAVPVGLERFDLIPASWLRFVPVGIALVIAAAFLAAAIGRPKSRRAK
jgi:divalent metal cation (Fe/Co/Zn/Cd) transporter